MGFTQNRGVRFDLSVLIFIGKQMVNALIMEVLVEVSLGVVDNYIVRILKSLNVYVSSFGWGGIYKDYVVFLYFYFIKALDVFHSELSKSINVFFVGVVACELSVLVKAHPVQ